MCTDSHRQGPEPIQQGEDMKDLDGDHDVLMLLMARVCVLEGRGRESVR